MDTRKIANKYTVTLMCLVFILLVSNKAFSATEKEGLWVSDLEIWKLHYASTLKLWRKNFNNNREKISQILNEKFCRMWEYYLLMSEYSFRNMGNFVFQMQISKNLGSLPFTRNYIYN